MKIFIFLYFILLNFHLIGQDALLFDSIKMNSSNMISGMYNNNSSIFNCIISGDNGIKKNRFTLSTNTAYNLQFNNKIISNELQQKTNFDYENFFLIHVFNHSMTRKIMYDNSYGIGIGKRWKFFSISYATLYQKTTYNNYTYIEVFRHSLRIKSKYSGKKFSISYEYYYQPNFKNIKDNIIYGNIKISLVDNKRINYSISDNINYRSFSCSFV
jgi:hypothetical protein